MNSLLAYLMKDVNFFKFFIEEKLPSVSMTALKQGGWEFIVKAIEYLDSELELEYDPTPMPLLWRVIRESLLCSPAAQKVMIRRLLDVSSREIKSNESPTYLHLHIKHSFIKLSTMLSPL